MFAQLRLLLVYVMLHTRSVKLKERTWWVEPPAFKKPYTDVEDTMLSLSEVRSYPIGSIEHLSEELQTLMPFTSKIDFDCLNAAIRYARIAKGYEKSRVKSPELEFGKWLVEMLYEKRRLDEAGLLTPTATRIRNQYMGASSATKKA